MKKLFVSAVAGLAMLGLALPASAFENEFGGYWRTRAFTQGDFGADGSQDLSRVDTRTQLNYTAKFSDNLKFVNVFQMNAVWGDEANQDTYGKVGGKGSNDVQVRRSYLDAGFGDFNVKIGIQPATVARGFLFDDEMAGVNVTYVGNGFDVPVMWVKAVEGGRGKDMNKQDVDMLIVSPNIEVAPNININPVLMGLYSDDSKLGMNEEGSFMLSDNKNYYNTGTVYSSEIALLYLGMNADMDFGMGSAWFTGIYQFGSIDSYETGLTGATKSDDVRAFLVALGGEVNIDPFSIHGQMFYASGQDQKGWKDGDDINVFVQPYGQSYYWSEIMGFGIFDNQASHGSPADQIGNIMAVNLGASMSPMERLTVTADIWYAELAEDAYIGTVNGVEKWEKELGTELNLKATYKVTNNLTLDVVGAYLFAGDATGKDDPYLVGTRLALSF
ncbi:hypothetical protein [Desulfobotulus mexicanus]|uniref:Alginate export domain-containing protein n=1 Tax=Desulfobotulus mexicanus TaxID=2586642 RepID=A0A5Q4VIE1_9BACT|nr:hypothetical protein [Desulfobotulus mexicanus]TYT76012.1 hypothetical protein FIM25_00200 [Desulfobotulus mexicanus]